MSGPVFATDSDEGVILKSVSLSERPAFDDEPPVDGEDDEDDDPHPASRAATTVALSISLMPPRTPNNAETFPSTGTLVDRMRPVIGICTSLARAQWGVWDRDAALLPREYITAIQQAGALTLMIPPDPSWSAIPIRCST